MSENKGDIEDLISAFGSTNQHIRLQAIQSSEARTDPRYISFLIAELQNEPVLCAAAIDALGEARNAQAIEPLTVLINTAEDISLRTRAVRALRQIGGPSAVNALADVLHNPMPQVRRATIVALGKFRGERSLALLISALSDVDVRVRISAILTLGELGDKRAVSPLMEICRYEVSDAEQKQIQEYVAYAIRRIYEQSI